MWKKALSCALHTRVIDDDRFRDVLAAIETTLPTEPLVYRISERIRPERLEDPAGWFRAGMLARDAASMNNGNKRAYVRLFFRVISPLDVVEGEPLGFMLVDFPDTPEFSSCAADLVRALGPAARAFRVKLSPEDDSVSIIEGAGRSGPPPRSGISSEGNSPSAIPRYFGWINYWSAESCGLLDFSPKDPRAALFAKVTPIEGHGLMLHLTDEPLDLTRPDHLAALTAAYRAFPAIDHARGP